MEKYKILTFGYGREEESLIVPDGTKFFKTDEFKDNGEWNEAKNLTNNSYISIVPCTKDNMDIIFSEGQAVRLYVYNLADEFLILMLEQVYPLEEFPITDIPPSIPHPIYLKWCNFRFGYDNWFTTFIKIHGFDKVNAANLDATVVYRRALNFEDVEVYEIERDGFEIGRLLLDRPKDITIKSSKEEFEKNFEEVLEKLKE